MTANQLRQALRPYTCHWVFWAVIAIWFVMHAPLPSASQQDLPEFVWMSLMANMALGTGIGAMLKTQFANPRARLLPGFRTAHLVATGGFVCAVLAVEAAMAPAWGGVAPRLAMLSVAALAMASSAWFAYSMISALWLLVAPMVLAPAIAPQLLVEATQTLVSTPLVSLGVTGFGLAAMATLGARLWRLGEESPEYSWQVPSGDITPRPGNRNLRKLEAQMVTRSRSLMWRLDLQFDLVVRNVRSMSPLRRLLFRQVATGFSGLSMLPSFLIIMVIVFWLQSGSERRFEAGELFFVTFLPVQIVLGMVGSIWLSRRTLLAPESLRPLNRRAFVRDQARSLACDIAPGAGAHCVLIFVYLKLIISDPSSEHLLPWLALTIIQYIVAYCLMLWLVSYRSLWCLIFGVSAISGLSSALVITALFAGHGVWSPLNLAVASIAVPLATVLLYQLAFRRWCNIDLA
jgi:hypothetical protein